MRCQPSTSTNNNILNGMEIMTGAPFPDGADAVIPVEWVAERSGANVSVGKSHCLSSLVTSGCSGECASFCFGSVIWNGTGLEEAVL